MPETHYRDNYTNISLIAGNYHNIKNQTFVPENNRGDTVYIYVVSVE